MAILDGKTFIPTLEEKSNKGKYILMGQGKGKPV